MFMGPQTDAVEAEQTIAYVDMFEGFTSFAGSMYGISLNYSGDGTWSDSWTGEGYTHTISVEQKSNGLYEWDLTIDGSYEGINYDNYLLYTGTVSGDCSSGDWTFFDWEGNSTVDYSYYWSTDDEGVVTATVDYPIDNSTIEISEDENGSGSIQYYQDGILRFTSTWTATNGSFISYDEDGAEIDSGSWG
jgi:hypothetical protein